MKVLSIILITMIDCILAIDLKACNNESEPANICKMENNYSSLDFPTPIPCSIDPELRIQEVVGIDEEKQVIHLIAKLVLLWNDTRINYNFVQGKKGVYHPWYLLDESIGVKIWTPHVYFTNSVSLLPGSHNFPKGSLWYNHPNGFMLQEMKEFSWACQMSFSGYPYDTHKCVIGFSNSIGTSDLVTLNPPKLYPRQQTKPKGALLHMSNNNVQFDITFRSLPSTTTQEFNSNYSLAQFELTLTRKPDGARQLVTSYFGPTLIFSVLSLTSFCIKLEQVPGRMGLLVTLCLITINTFNSVVAPTRRGISFIEKWMLGIFVPIITAIIEYGTLLFISKYKEKLVKMNFMKEDRNVESVSQTIDVATFIWLALYQLLFSLCFWIGTYLF